MHNFACLVTGFSPFHPIEQTKILTLMNWLDWNPVLDCFGMSEEIVLTVYSRLRYYSATIDEVKSFYFFFSIFFCFIIVIYQS